MNLIMGKTTLTEGVKEAFKKLQLEILEQVDITDFRLHVFTVYSIMKGRLENNSSVL